MRSTAKRLSFNRSRGTSAKQYFFGSHDAAPARAPYQRNEYSGNLSGPILIPHLYNGRGPQLLLCQL